MPLTGRLSAKEKYLAPKSEVLSSKETSPAAINPSLELKLPPELLLEISYWAQLGEALFLKQQSSPEFSFGNLIPYVFYWLNFFYQAVTNYLFSIQLDPYKKGYLAILAYSRHRDSRWNDFDTRNSLIELTQAVFQQRTKREKEAFIQFIKKYRNPYIEEETLIELANFPQPASYKSSKTYEQFLRISKHSNEMKSLDAAQKFLKELETAYNAKNQFFLASFLGITLPDQGSFLERTSLLEKRITETQGINKKEGFLFLSSLSHQLNQQHILHAQLSELYQLIEKDPSRNQLETYFEICAQVGGTTGALALEKSLLLINSIDNSFWYSITWNNYFNAAAQIGTQTGMRALEKGFPLIEKISEEQSRSLALQAYFEVATQINGKSRVQALEKGFPIIESITDNRNRYRVLRAYFKTAAHTDTPTGALALEKGFPLIESITDDRFRSNALQNYFKAAAQIGGKTQIQALERGFPLIETISEERSLTEALQVYFEAAAQTDTQISALTLEKGFPLIEKINNEYWYNVILKDYFSAAVQIGGQAGLQALERGFPIIESITDDRFRSLTLQNYFTAIAEMDTQAGAQALEKGFALIEAITDEQDRNAVLNAYTNAADQMGIHTDKAETLRYTFALFPLITDDQFSSGPLQSYFTTIAEMDTQADALDLDKELTLIEAITDEQDRSLALQAYFNAAAQMDAQAGAQALERGFTLIEPFKDNAYRTGLLQTYFKACGKIGGKAGFQAISQIAHLSNFSSFRQNEVFKSFRSAMEQLAGVLDWNELKQLEEIANSISGISNKMLFRLSYIKIEKQIADQMYSQIIDTLDTPYKNPARIYQFYQNYLFAKALDLPVKEDVLASWENWVQPEWEAFLNYLRYTLYRSKIPFPTNVKPENLPKYLLTQLSEDQKRDFLVQYLDFGGDHYFSRALYNTDVIHQIQSQFYISFLAQLSRAAYADGQKEPFIQLVKKEWHVATGYEDPVVSEINHQTFQRIWENVAELLYPENKTEKEVFLHEIAPPIYPTLYFKENAAFSYELSL